MIADQAGVSVGLLYHYLESKEILLEAVFENSMMIISEGFISALEDGDPNQRVANILRYIFSALQEDRDFWGLFYSLRSQPAVMRVLGDDFRHWTAQLRDLLTENLDAAGRSDPELEALILYSLIEGTIQQYLLDPENYPLEIVAEQIISEYSAVEVE